MMNWLVALFLFLPFLNTNPRYIEWSPERPLQWTDFKGKPDSYSHSHAGTAVKIEVKPSVVRGKVHYEVSALFDSQKSWFKRTSDDLLSHEQLHFDIAELTARKIRTRVAYLRSKRVKDADVYNREVKKILKASNALDRRYDKETLHGILPKKQERWEKYISKELSKLNNYSSQIR